MTTSCDSMPLPWPRSGMMRSGTVFQLSPLAHSTIAIESGLLPTPIRTDGFTIAQFSVRTQLSMACGGYQPRFWARLAASGWSLKGNCETYERIMGFPTHHTV